MNDLRQDLDRGSASLLIPIISLGGFRNHRPYNLSGRPGRVGIGQAGIMLVPILPLQKDSEGGARRLLFVPLAFGLWSSSGVSFVSYAIYMKPWGEVIGGYIVWCYQYADDTHHYLSVPANPKEVMDTLNWCLDGEMGWMRANEMKLNPNKP